MKDGAIVAQGPPGEVVTEAMVHDVFGIDSVVLPDPVSGTPMVVPRSRHHARNGDAGGAVTTDQSGSATVRSISTSCPG